MARTIVGFEVDDHESAQQSMACSYSSSQPCTPLSPLTALLKTTKLAPQHRRSLSLEDAGNSSARSVETCWMVTSSADAACRGVAIPFHTSRSSFVVGSEQTFTSYTNKERTSRITAAADPCKEADCSVEELEEEEPCQYEDEEVFELEIPVPALPFLRGLTRIKTNLRRLSGK